MWLNTLWCWWFLFVCCDLFWMLFLSSIPYLSVYLCSLGMMDYVNGKKISMKVLKNKPANLYDTRMVETLSCDCSEAMWCYSGRLSSDCVLCILWWGLWMVSHCQRQPAVLIRPCEGLWNFTWWKRKEKRVGKRKEKNNHGFLTNYLDYRPNHERQCHKVWRDCGQSLKLGSSAVSPSCIRQYSPSPPFPLRNSNYLYMEINQIWHVGPVPC